MIKTIESKVKNMMDADPTIRNMPINKFVSKYWATYDGVIVRPETLAKLTNMSTVIRVRQKLAAKDERYQADDPKVLRNKNIAENNMRDYALD
jgi:hypothetical protein